MKFEKLKKDNRKYWILGIIALVAITASITYVSTRAYYRTTQSVQVAVGTINYTNSDLNIVAIKLKDGDTYTNSDTIPTNGVTLNETESMCKVGEEKQDVNITYSDGKITIANITKKGTKCTLVFDIKSTMTIDELIAFIGIQSGTPDFSKTSCAVSTNNGSNCEETANGLYATTSVYNDDYGTSYYFRGSVDNNWLKFGIDKDTSKPIYWRIIRINGNGTMRIIYGGLEQNDGSAPATIGEGTQIQTSAFNSSYNDNAYVGYMYGSAGATNYNNTHANTNDSTIKGVLDTWYGKNIRGTKYENLVEGSTGFCGDRSLDPIKPDSFYTNLGYGQEMTAYGAYDRLYTNKKPSLKCKQQKDLFTTANVNNTGNKALTSPVGLITADEVALAGGKFYANNYGYYLYTGQSYWTISPSHFNGNTAFVDSVYSSGDLYNNKFENIVSNSRGVRPVLVLSSDTQFAGTGASSDPFIVKVN